MKELITYLKNCKKNNSDIGALTDEDIEKCIKSLDKQVCKKVKKIFKSADGTTDFKCPDCNEKIGIGFKFCHNCGKAVKW